MNTPGFWKATGERVLSTFVQAYFGLFLAGDLVFDVFDFNWVNGLGPALGISILTLVKCVLASGFGHAGPSLANETTVAEPPSGRHAAVDNGPAV